jgi:hypothetical protein
MQNADAIAQGQRDDGNRTVAELISAYEQGIEELRAAVAGMTAKQVRSRPSSCVSVHGRTRSPRAGVSTPGLHGRRRLPAHRHGQPGHSNSGLN